jgi:hypothetical protein
MDAYAGLFREDVPFPDQEGPAWQLPGMRFTGPQYRVTIGTLSVRETLAKAHEKGVSLTELLTALYIAALQDISQGEAKGGEKLPIRIQVPVNMRKLYPSETLRNFFLYVSVSIDQRLGYYEFDEILSRVHHGLRLHMNAKEFIRQIKRNVRGERYWFSRIVPLFIKHAYLRGIGAKAAARPFSGNLSNLTAVTMPEPFVPHIRRFDLLPQRKIVSGVGIGVASWGDVLSVTLGSMITNRDFERVFFSRCSDLGLSVTVESN